MRRPASSPALGLAVLGAALGALLVARAPARSALAAPVASRPVPARTVPAPGLALPAAPERRATPASGDPLPAVLVVDDGTGRPIQGARVVGYLPRPGGGARPCESVTDAAGLAPRPVPLDRALEVRAEGYVRRVLARPSGLEPGPVRLRRVSPRLVTLAVVDVAGRPVAGAQVEVETRRERRTGATDPAGHATFALAATGDLLRARGTLAAPGFVPRAFELADDGGPAPRLLDAEPGEPPDRLVLERPGVLRGRVLDAAGRPAGGTRVELTRAPAARDACSPAAPGAELAVRTSADGTFVVADLPADRPWSARVAAGLSVVADDSSDVELR